MKLLTLFVLQGVLTSGTDVQQSAENAEIAKNITQDEEMNKMRQKLELEAQKPNGSALNQHDRIKKLEEEYSRRVEEIKRKHLAKKAERGGSSGTGGRDRSDEKSASAKKGKDYLPAPENMDLFERTAAEQKGRLYVVGDFDLLDEDTKPEIYEQFTLLIRPRSLECFGVYLEPGYQVEVSMESENSEIVNGNMRSPDGKIIAKLKSIDEMKNWGSMFVSNMPKGHYQICAFNFQGMAHVSRLKIEILVEFDEIAKRRNFERKHEELEHLLAEAGVAPDAVGQVTKERGFDFL